ncbi:hypothetical protein JCM9140_3912 [Halalkalibacter wakoensis JCM 9140]|uniref:Integral membrane protein n=1 Tax=Halalkalibacter wakoensis JCM 9140 TaxID=1236970 RepID=W4Q710_9BACI|nr:DUF975 family protein [Halalkalibacter wakoensis]GAE27755.1 hypothetical protein JCM9140_3912 [Halalkalibacter wakoensis JCM 9140]
MHFVYGNWLKITGMVLLVYIIKMLLGTMPISGTMIIRFDPLSVLTSRTLMSLLAGALVNSILFFIMIDYITRSEQTMSKRFQRACTYPFRHPQLLFKGFFVLFITYLFIQMISLMSIYSVLGTLFMIAADINVRLMMVFVAFVSLFALFIWLFLGLSQVLYILYDDPKKGTFRSMKESFSIMKGHRWALFGFFLLTGVAFILGFVLFLIGAIVSLVIFEVARLAFYRDLLRKKRQKEWLEKV